MYISYIHKAESETGDSPGVHPFYKHSFAALYDIPESMVETNAVSKLWTLSALKGTLSASNKETKVGYFFDVRTTEDFSCPAPEYKLLDFLKLKHTVPLGIKGMGSLALVQAFRIAEQYISNQEAVLFCTVEQYHRFDAISDDLSKGHATTFLVTAESGEYRLESARLFPSEEALQCSLSNEAFDAIYIDSCCHLTNATGMIKIDPFLTDAIIRFSNDAKEKNTFRAACISSYHNTYGYYILVKGSDMYEI